mgnify:CR=1 FL=1
MLHCGDPISYTNLNSKYWQEHFYSYGTFTVTPERICMAKRLSRIERDIERLKEKISEYQQQLKELEA